MAEAAAAAIALLGVEGDGDVAAFPDSVDVRPASITDAVAQRPHTGELVELAACGGNSSGNGVGIVSNMDGGGDVAQAERSGQLIGQVHAFELRKVWRILHHAGADDAWNGHADGIHRQGVNGSQGGDEGDHQVNEFAAGDGGQGVDLIVVFWIADELSSEAQVLEPSSSNVVSDYYADCGGHCGLPEEQGDCTWLTVTRPGSD